MDLFLKLFWINSFLFCLFSESTAQPLDSLYKLAIENNAELKALEAEYNAVLLKQDQVQLQNPQLGVGVPVLRPETRLGPQMMMVSASQMFPWFGALSAQRDVYLQMSKTKYESISAVKLDLFYNIKVAYYQLLFIDQKDSIFSETIRNYQSLESLVLAKVETGNATIADVLRIQTKIDGYITFRKQLEVQKRKLYAEINKETNQPLNQPVHVLDSLDINLAEYDLENYRLRIQEYHPLVKKLNSQIDMSQSILVANQKMNAPKIGIGLDYSLVNPRLDASPVNNGQDILIPKLMVSIPIYRNSYNAVIEEQKLNQEALVYSKEDLTDDIISKIISFKTEYDIGESNYHLAKDQLLKIKSAYEISLGIYSSNHSGFEDLLSIQNDLINLRLKLKLSLLTMAISKANIVRLTDF